MTRCHEDHAALRKQLRDAVQMTDSMLMLQREEALAEEDAARCAHDLVMAAAAACKADVTRMMQLDAIAHQVLADVHATRR